MIKKTFMCCLFKFHRILNIFILLIYVKSSTAKYAEDSEEASPNEGGGPGEGTPKPSEDSYEDNEVNQGNEDQEELPEGFEVLDGVVLDTTNLIIQEAAGEWTQYKMYEPSTQVSGKVLYKRPRREAGWHFIMFEDPMEISGLGHLVLLQKLLGFSIEPNKLSSKSKELRLYEIFHVDLGNDFVEDESDTDDDNQGSDENKNSINKEDPNDSADIEPAMKEEPPDLKLDEKEKDAVKQIDENLSDQDKENDNNDATDSPNENEDKSMQDTPVDTDAQNIDSDKQEDMDET